MACQVVSEDHTFIDLTGDIHQGMEMMVAGWTNYFSSYPVCINHLSELYQMGDRIIMMVQITVCHLKIPKLQDYGTG